MESLSFQPSSSPIPIARKVKVEDTLYSAQHYLHPLPTHDISNEDIKNNAPLKDEDGNNTENENGLDNTNNEIQSPRSDTNLPPFFFGANSWSSSSSWFDICEEELKERKDNEKQNENESEVGLGEKRKSVQEGVEKKKKKKKSESKKKAHELRKVFVGNLQFSKPGRKESPVTAKEENALRIKTIERIFSQFGSIIKVIPFWLDKNDFMEVDTEKMKTTSHCFVLFASKHAAERSVKELADHQRRVDICKEIRKRKPLPSFYARLCSEAENIINENSKAQTTTTPSNTTSNTETAQTTQITQTTPTSPIEDFTQTIIETQATVTTQATTSDTTETESTTEMTDT
eukprot:TRINITY_DN5224_c0_g2_i2.p1 TRINITY_DN5224_c0_g2~~TRINITY_DN5224_c0_g2_i2.p1  ORF type:complete len:392 (+),score=124.48 TRINITY_DN5224_c0_g2_i2:142-1176(+)